MKEKAIKEDVACIIYLPEFINLLYHVEFMEIGHILSIESIAIHTIYGIGIFPMNQQTITFKKLIVYEDLLEGTLRKDKLAFVRNAQNWAFF